jgi:FkbM family methyltransferase
MKKLAIRSLWSSIRNRHRAKKVMKTIEQFAIARKISISTIYDIGAHNGEWSRVAKKVFSRATFYLFEANPTKIQYLSDFEPKVFSALLGDVDQELRNFYSIMGTGDSTYKELTGCYDNVEPVKLQTTTLDSIVKVEQLELPDFVKVDVQGSEVAVLRGAISVMRFCKMLLCEIPLVQYNEGAPNILEYLSLIDEMGFSPIRVIDQHSSRHKLVHIDVLFARTEDSNSDNFETFYR